MPTFPVSLFTIYGHAETRIVFDHLSPADLDQLSGKIHTPYVPFAQRLAQRLNALWNPVQVSRWLAEQGYRFSVETVATAKALDARMASPTYAPDEAERVDKLIEAFTFHLFEFMRNAAQ